MYFDHKRRTDPNFRKQLKKESKRQARAAKEEAEAHTTRRRQAIGAAVEEAKEEGFPMDVEEKEAYFMDEVAKGEQLAASGMCCLGKILLFHQPDSHHLQGVMRPKPRSASTKHSRSTHSRRI